MKKLVVFTGAGVSADSGIATFRDSDGLWANYRIEEVCTPEALARDRAKVVEFYNLRRRETLSKEPNAAHRAIAELEKWFDVEVVTQNVDNLHERAGSSYIIHLHGELMKVTSSISPNDSRYVKTLDEEHLEVRIGDLADDGSQLRPFIVWFGESVPEIEKAAEECAKAEMLIVIGTSLNVYPAAGLTRCVAPGTPIYLIDPNPVTWNSNEKVHHIVKGASEGMKELFSILNISL